MTLWSLARPWSYCADRYSAQARQASLKELEDIADAVIQELYLGATPPVAYRRSLFDLSRFDRLAEQLGFNRALVQQLFEDKFARLRAWQAPAASRSSGGYVHTHHRSTEVAASPDDPR